MPYQARVGRRVRKEMARLPQQDQARVFSAIRALADEPRPAGCRPVKAADAGTYSVRVGDYRIVYAVLDDEEVVLVARVARRSEDTYRGLG